MLVFTKTGKAINNNNVKISVQQQEIIQLQALVDQYKPQRKAKVRVDPNERFVRIPDVIAARERAVAQSKREAERKGQLSNYDLETQQERDAQFASWCYELSF